MIPRGLDAKGVTTTISIPPDTVIASIPHSLLITPTTAEMEHPVMIPRHAIIRPKVPHDPIMNGALTLAWWIACMRHEVLVPGRGGRYKGWVNSVPHTSPVDDVAAEGCASRFQSRADYIDIRNDMEDFLRYQYEYYRDQICHPPYESLRWGWRIVWNRGVLLPTDALEEADEGDKKPTSSTTKDSSNLTIIPFIDSIRSSTVADPNVTIEGLQETTHKDLLKSVKELGLRRTRRKWGTAGAYTSHIVVKTIREVQVGEEFHLPLISDVRSVAQRLYCLGE
eukprot:PhF_6_TR31698/c0_g1_i1/m.46639